MISSPGISLMNLGVDLLGFYMKNWIYFLSLLIKEITSLVHIANLFFSNSITESTPFEIWYFSSEFSMKLIPELISDPFVKYAKTIPLAVANTNSLVLEVLLHSPILYFSES